MSQQTSASHEEAATAQSPLRFVAFTAVAAVTAAIAALVSASLQWPVWAMFVGWVAYFTRGGTWRSGIANYGCLGAGLALGIGAAHAIALAQPHVGAAALPLVVFVVASVVLSLRATPPLNNLLCYFLGLIAFFAAHQPPTLSTLLALAAPTALGGLAAWVSTWLQART